MGIDQDILGPDGWHAALAALAWQVDLGADEAIAEVPLDRYATAEAGAARRVGTQQVARATLAAVVPGSATDPVAVATAAAAGAATLVELQAALAAFDLCEIKRGAKTLVFADGNPAARVLILGEAPGRDEDQAGLPFVGPAGQLLDRMFAAIGLSRHSPDAMASIYITNVMPWRPPQNRDPSPEEIAMMRPFVERHIGLVGPDIIVALGNTPTLALLGRSGILRLRGHWAEALGRPVMPMTHPAYLLRNPAAKRDSWADLQSIRARLGSGGR